MPRPALPVCLNGPSPAPVASSGKIGRTWMKYWKMWHCLKFNICRNHIFDGYQTTDKNEKYSRSISIFWANGFCRAENPLGLATGRRVTPPMRPVSLTFSLAAPCAVNWMRVSRVVSQTTGNVWFPHALLPRTRFIEAFENGWQQHCEPTAGVCLAPGEPGDPGEDTVTV